MISKVIKDKIDIDKILIVTFTNAAASEMRERILDAIYKQIDENPEDEALQKQIILLNKASICTIHSFCLDVIRNHFYELDIPANFRVGDTGEIELLKQDVIEELFEEKYLNNDKEFIKLINTYTNYRDDESLKELTNMFEGSKYITLTKTYRSTDKIIDYTNKILGLTLSVAIRNQKSNDIIFRNNVKKEDFVKDITYLKDMSKSIAIITKDDKEAEEVYNMLKDEFDIMLLGGYGHIKRDLVVVPSYTAKGLEFDSVIIYNDMDNKYTKEDKYLYYVACTRAQHNLIIYNGEE